MINEIVLDMDGTLYSSENIILPAYEQGINSFNKQYPEKKIAVPKLNEILCLLGFPLDHIYKILFPYLSVDERDLLRPFIENELISGIQNKKGTLFAGVSQTVADLYNRRYKLFIASNGADLYLQTILQTYNLIDFFNPIITLDYQTIVDKGDILLEYRKKNQINAGSAIMVGDRDSDWVAAKKLGCRFIACDYGHGNRSEIEAADIIISSFTELLNWLNHQ